MIYGFLNNEIKGTYYAFSIQITKFQIVDIKASFVKSEISII